VPLITKISDQKRRPNRRNIHLDGRFAFGCNLNVVAKFKLREGLALTEIQVHEIQQGEVKQEAIDYALKLLERRLHSSAELSRKLTTREYGPPIIDEVLSDLKRLGYIDDARFAKTKALSAAEHKQHGKRRALVELIKSGVKGEVARKALDEVYDSRDTLAVAKKLAEKQAPRLRKLDPQVARRRLVGMLQRRGFDYEDIKGVIESVLGRDDETS
jgi:regulatory protein